MPLYWECTSKIVLTPENATFVLRKLSLLLSSAIEFFTYALSSTISAMVLMLCCGFARMVGRM